MPASQSNPNNSFIPKRGPARRVKRAVTRQVYLFTIVLYVLIFTSLVSAAAVYAYDLYIERHYNEVVLELNEAVDSFNEDSYERVARMHSRLAQSQSILESQVSFAGLLEIIEQNLSPLVTVRTLVIAPAESSETEVPTFLVEASMASDELDAVIFQRDYLRDKTQIQSFIVESLTAALEGTSIGIDGVEIPTTQPDQLDEDASVEFTATFEVSANDIRVDSEQFTDALRRLQPITQGTANNTFFITPTSTSNNQLP